MSETLVFVLNGPNLNLLGTRDPARYGSATLGDVEALCRDEAAALGLEVEFRQSNHEGDLVDWVQEADASACGVVLNAGAYARTSLALHDAVQAVGTPVIEVHIANFFNKEAYRPASFLSPVAAGFIAGLGIDVYPLALRAIHMLAARAGA